MEINKQNAKTVATFECMTPRNRVVATIMCDAGVYLCRRRMSDYSVITGSPTSHAEDAISDALSFVFEKIRCESNEIAARRPVAKFELYQPKEPTIFIQTGSATAGYVVWDGYNDAEYEDIDSALMVVKSRISGVVEVA